MTNDNFAVAIWKNSNYIAGHVLCKTSRVFVYVRCLQPGSSGIKISKMRMSEKFCKLSSNILNTQEIILNLLRMQNLWRKKLYKVCLDRRILPELQATFPLLVFILPLQLNFGQQPSFVVSCCIGLAVMDRVWLAIMCISGHTT